jgi:hypothetical protein
VKKKKLGKVGLLASETGICILNSANRPSAFQPNYGYALAALFSSNSSDGPLASTVGPHACRNSADSMIRSDSSLSYASPTLQNPNSIT